MEYTETINSRLKPWTDADMNRTVVDLFAGCGGLSLGFEANGFRTIGYEMDERAADGYNKNLLGECVAGKLTPESRYPKADVVIGGPPCQPFSVGGRQLGLRDARDGFPIFLSAVRQLAPEVFLFEDVRGMLYKNRWYLKEVMDELGSMDYHMDHALLNAVDYEVPQNRERVIVLGSKRKIRLPRPIRKTVTAGEALGNMAFAFDESSKFFNASMDRYVANYEKASKCTTPRDLHLDRPARTLTCRNLAGATGDMHRLRLKDGRGRRSTVREVARLQSFPDWFAFQGTETQQYTQIGNAVAPNFAYHLAKNIKEHLMGTQENDRMVMENEQLSLFEHGTVS